MEDEKPRDRWAWGDQEEARRARIYAAAPEMLEQLRQLEWAGFSPKSGSCPQCEGFRRGEGHKPDCELGNLIDRIDGAE